MAGGVILTGWQQFLLEGLSTNVPGDHILPQGERALFLDVARQVGGAFTDTQTIDIRQELKSGARTRTFFDDYYNRIHIIPAFLDFGAISGTASQSALVWNAYVTPSVLTEIDETTPEGTTLFGPVLPLTMKPLSVFTLRVDATADGPPSIDATYTLQFGAHGSPRLRVVGTAARLWTWGPNWSAAVDSTREFLTEVITSRSGKEQRIADRATPRRTISFTTLVTGEEKRAMQRVLHTWQSRLMVLPDPTRKATVVLGMPVGGVSVDVDAVPSWLVAGVSVALEDGETTDTRIVESVVDQTVTFTSQSGRIWDADTVIRPALSGNMEVSMAGRSPTDNVYQVDVDFTVRPASETATETTAPVTFNGREVFTLDPNWAVTPSTTFRYPREDVDYSRGRINSYFPVEFATRQRQAAYVGRTAAEAEQIAAFFDRMLGRQGEFYMATGEHDLPLRDGPSVGTNFIRAIGDETADAYADDTVFRAVRLLLVDGSVHYRAVSEIYVVDDVEGRDTILEFGAELWAADVDLDDVVMVSWMPVWRHSTDKIIISYLTDEVTQTQLNLTSLEDLTAEAIA